MGCIGKVGVGWLWLWKWVRDGRWSERREREEEVEQVGGWESGSSSSRSSESRGQCVGVGIGMQADVSGTRRTGATAKASEADSKERQIPRRKTKGAVKVVKLSMNQSEAASEDVENYPTATAVSSAGRLR